MARDRVLQRAFTGGEQSPNLDARADLARWRASMARIENFVVLMTGGATRRGGFRDVHAALPGSILVPFSFSASDGYAIEFAPAKCRFYRDYGILLDGPAPYELATPFTADDLLRLDYAQSADVLFLASGKRPIQKLSRLGPANWTIQSLDAKLGPFLDENSDESITLSKSAGGEITKGSSFTLSASAPLFQAGHVGSLWRIAVNDRSKYSNWAAVARFAVGDFKYWGENLYKCTALFDIAGGPDSTGTNPPVHLFGEAWDGPETDLGGGAKWQYLHSGWGVVKVTAFINSMAVTVEAQTYIPRDLEDGVWRWAEGAWSNVRGYPRVLAFHQKRLIAACTDYQPTRLWASVIDDYPNFKAGTLATDSFGYTLQGSANKVDVIEWLVSGGRLSIGTAGDEFAIPKSSTREPITPANIVIDNATTEGSKAAKAIKIDAPIFISKDGRRLHEPGFDYNSDEYIAPDLTIFADHVTESGIAELAWQREPYRLLWARRNDGVLACCTYRKDQQVTAWHRHFVSKGAVKSIAVSPSPDPTRQDLWAIVEYTLASGVHRRVQSLAPFFERGDFDVRNGNFLDSSFLYSGPPATTISNIPAFMEGETVGVLADGKLVADRIVTGGAITLPFAASKAILGLKYVSKLQTLRYDRDAGGGPLAGKKSRVAGIVVDLLRSGGVKLASGDREPEYVLDESGIVMGAPARLMTGTTRRVPVEAGWEDGNINGAGVVTLVCEDALPATIRALTLDMQVSG